MKLKKIKMFISSIMLAGLTANANAIIISDSVTGYIGSGEVDYFTINTTGYGVGDFTLDVLAYGYNGTYLDSEIFLFQNNTSGALVGANDDCWNATITGVCPEGSTDGSTSVLDSFLHFDDLAAGVYVLAIGAFNLTESEARVGYNQYTEGRGYYQITATLEYGDVSVPAPGALLLLATGLIGVGISRRRSLA